MWYVLQNMTFYITRHDPLVDFFQSEVSLRYHWVNKPPFSLVQPGYCNAFRKMYASIVGTWCPSFRTRSTHVRIRQAKHTRCMNVAISMLARTVMQWKRFNLSKRVVAWPDGAVHHVSGLTRLPVPQNWTILHSRTFKNLHSGQSY